MRMTCLRPLVQVVIGLGLVACSVEKKLSATALS
jgi:hypothetical protein